MLAGARPHMYDAARLNAALENVGLDALVLSRPPNVLYATRYRRGGLTLLPRVSEVNTLYVGAADLDFILEDLADGVRVRGHGVFYRFRARGSRLTPDEERIWTLHEATDRDRDAVALLAEDLEALGLGSARVGFDKELPRIAGLLPQLERVPAQPLMREMRMVKTPQEVARLRRAVDISERAITATVAAVHLGVSQHELARVFRRSVIECSDAVRMDTVSFGAATVFGNTNRPDERLAGDSLIRFDVGAIYAGYASDLSRCYAFESVGQRVHDYYNALVEGQNAMFAELRPGVRACDLFEVAVTRVREAGIHHYERVHTGHGIGITGEGYDAPLLGPSDETELQAGMVLCVETPYFEHGFGGLQLEDMVVITEAGYESLSRLSRELEQLR